jgi:hypothetical protein
LNIGSSQHSEKIIFLPASGAALLADAVQDDLAEIDPELALELALANPTASALSAAPAPNSITT